VWLPQWIEERPEVSEKAKKLYAYLTFFAGGKGYAWPSFGLLAQKLHCSRRHAMRLVQELSAHRLITVTNVSNPERGHCAQEGTREEIAHRYRVSLGMVKKLLQQRRHTGEIGARHHRSGRKPMILATHQRQMRALLGKKPDLTLKELRAAVALECSLPAIHYALAKMGLTYKKRRSGPASKTVPTSRGPAGRGGGARVASIPPG
jgi:transposase